VEQVLRQLDAVDEACVVGLPDPDWGHRVVAVITLRAEAEIAAHDVLDFCASRLAAFETPRDVHFWESLPRSALMKISRQRVRDMLSPAAENEKKRAR
jgi:fatty-acyl-CoA synthase